MNLKSDKKKIIALSSIGLLTVLGGTLAYFYTSTSVVNKFQTGVYQNQIVEEFVAPYNWTPGTKTKKEISVKNTGSVSMGVRAKLSEEWVNKNGEKLALLYGNKDAAIKEFGSSKWVLKDDGYYYYMDENDKLIELLPNETTELFLKSVTFNENVGAHLIKEVSDDGNTITYRSSGNGYDNATYTLEVSLDTIQYDQAESIWLK